MVIKINAELLPIKSHYFCFMAAMGPILPQIFVYGKQMGVSSTVMGTVNAILPIIFLLAKPLFGLIVDIYREYRKSIFIGLILTMSIAFSVLNVIPTRHLQTLQMQTTCDQLDTCNVTEIDEKNCETTTSMICSCSKQSLRNLNNFNSEQFPLWYVQDYSSRSPRTCVPGNVSAHCTIKESCYYKCRENIETSNSCLYTSWTFWLFIVCMSLGCIGFNVTNSISDAICFDVIGEEFDYGKQRVWGTIGFGVTALISGYLVNSPPGSHISYTPAFIVMLIFIGLDLFSCWKLKLPIMETPENIFKDLRKLLNNRHSITFILYAVFAGIVDSFFIYYLFWYLEDLAIATKTPDIKLLEGLIVAAETLGGEVIFFSISGKILERFGHAHCFSMCFINYALRLGLISIVPSPWWILPIEFVLQGPTYALTYTTVVAYANAIAAPGTSATMQGIAAGMDDGFGYAIGSFVGGILYKQIGGRGALQIFSAFAMICSISHLFLYKIFLQHREEPNQETEYKTPAEAALATYDTSTMSDIHCI